ncbi:MAG: hypothetical protein U0518_02125 [Candidatus Gracilibacteria bacterium]
MNSNLIKSLEESCHNILIKNLERTTETVYILYDTLSPLATIVSDAYMSAFGTTEGIIFRRFIDPPAPLYRGGLINPKNPHQEGEKRIMSEFNQGENLERGLNHQEEEKAVTEELISEEVESIKHDLLSLPAGSIVVLIQSSNFRLSTFRIRLELFHRGVHVVEHNHLSYIPESQFETFIRSHEYRTPYYISEFERLSDITQSASGLRIYSSTGEILQVGETETMRGNTGDYRGVINKGGTFPLGEVFTEAKDLESVNGVVMVNTYPNTDFSIEQVKSFPLHIENGRVLANAEFPEGFQKIYQMVLEHEGEVMVREIGFGLNTAISTEHPLSDVNFHERKHGIHLSLGKKHGIYGKKLPKTMLQRYHIDLFVDLDRVETPEHGIIFQQKQG